jgi:hypothetical protein
MIDYNKYVYFYVVVLNTLGSLGYTLSYFKLYPKLLWVLVSYHNV